VKYRKSTERRDDKGIKNLGSDLLNAVSQVATSFMPNYDRRRKYNETHATFMVECRDDRRSDPERVWAEGSSDRGAANANTQACRAYTGPSSQSLHSGSIAVYAKQPFLRDVEGRG
jgi:hypothetical protein